MSSHGLLPLLQNLTLALVSVVLATLPTLAGVFPLWLAVTLHEGSTLLVALNSLRLLLDAPSAPSAAAAAAGDVKRGSGGEARETGEGNSAGQGEGHADEQVLNRSHQHQHDASPQHRSQPHFQQQQAGDGVRDMKDVWQGDLVTAAALSGGSGSAAEEGNEMTRGSGAAVTAVTDTSRHGGKVQSHGHHRHRQHGHGHTHIGRHAADGCSKLHRH